MIDQWFLKACYWKHSSSSNLHNFQDQRFLQFRWLFNQLFVKDRINTFNNHHCMKTSIPIKLSKISIQIFKWTCDPYDGLTHADFVGRFLKLSNQTQAKSRVNATTSPILKNQWTVNRFLPDYCLESAWIFSGFCVGRQNWHV